jgi:hypothetical protein
VLRRLMKVRLLEPAFPSWSVLLLLSGLGCFYPASVRESKGQTARKRLVLSLLSTSYSMCAPGP